MPKTTHDPDSFKRPREELEAIIANAAENPSAAHDAELILRRYHHSGDRAPSDKAPSLQPNA